MSAPGIPYSGVLARKGVDNDSADVDAGVFRGLKFWVSIRVPQRKVCVGTIEENGGTVVPKEGNADILICDEAREPVPGSYSYQLISDAVKEGSLDMKEDYMCNSLAPRLGTSNKRAPKPKLTRTTFTEQDDRILAKFVTERERLGQPIGGNDIYKELAQEYPRHTWQSWRDRWAKKLKSIPRPPVSDKKQSPQPKGTLVASGRETAVDRSPVTRSRARFTAEEDDILLEIIHHAIENHKPWNGYPPYEQLASEFPQRTYLAWRERALNHVAKQNKDQIAQWEFEAGFHSSDNEDAHVDDANEQQTPTVENNARTKLAVTSQASGNAPVQIINRLGEGHITHKSTNGDGNEDQGTISSPTHRARSVKPSTDAKLPAKGDLPNYSTSSPIFDMPQLPEDGVTITTEGQFYRDYNTFLESAGITERRIPSVRGKAIALWDLWQSVRSKKVETAELDWQQVAEDLGFNWISMESIPEDLQQCYEEHLAPFADAMMSFNESSDEGDPTEDNTDAETERLLPSSPPVLPSLKRPLATTSPVYVPQSSPKRRRIDRSHEISSTPQHGNGNFNLRSRGSSDKTPTNSRLGRSGVIEPVSRTQARSSARDGDEITNLPEQPQGRKRTLEPETQDFNFGPDTQLYTHGEGLDHFDDDSQRGTTPSQQLLLESDARSPQIQYNTPDLAASRQETAQITPTPRRRIRVPLQLDDSDDDDVQRNGERSRSTRAPLSTQQAQPKRRTLPSSFLSKPSVSSIVVQNDQQSSATVPETEPQRRPSPPEETPDDIIDRFVSLGYAKDIVLRSLKATSWIIGNAGQVMEMLQQGEPLPPRTTGVWTQRDDDSLELVYSHNPPSTTKEEKKREKEMKRLQAKHGAEQIALRKRYLLDELSE
ncbi:TRF2-interacting telomeric protein/Rap1 C terminal domain-containing protein [Ustulina deusta]|nr:TRF2-interacting telomeric protein/Rap1 C terminal domain-containing protein [Ustulina deusta]